MTVQKLNVRSCTQKLLEAKVSAADFRDAVDGKWKLENLTEIMKSVGAYSETPCLTSIIRAFANRGGIGNGIVATIMEKYGLEASFESASVPKVLRSFSLVDCGEKTMPAEDRMDLIGWRIPEAYPNAYVLGGDGKRMKPSEFVHSGDASIDWLTRSIIMETRNVSVMEDGEIRRYPEELPDEVRKAGITPETGLTWLLGTLSSAEVSRSGKDSPKYRAFLLQQSPRDAHRFLSECLPDIEKHALNFSLSRNPDRSLAALLKSGTPSKMTESEASAFLEAGPFAVLEKTGEWTLFLYPSDKAGLPEGVVYEYAVGITKKRDCYRRAASPGRKSGKKESKAITPLPSDTMNTNQEKFLGKLLSPEQKAEFDKIGRVLVGGIGGPANSQEFKAEFLRKAKTSFVGTGKKKRALLDILVRNESGKEADEALSTQDYSAYIEHLMNGGYLRAIDAEKEESTPTFAVFGTRILDAVRAEIGTEAYDEAVSSVTSKESIEDFKKEIISGYGTAPGEKERETVEALMEAGYDGEVATAIYEAVSAKK